MIHPGRLLLLASTVMIFLAGIARSTTIDVSPQGPVRSLDVARDAARHARDSGEKGQITIRIADGTYPVTGPLMLEPRDSNLTYEAAPNAHPVITGGRRLTGFKVGADGIWTLQIPEVQQGNWYFDALWINGQRATRARTPKRGFLNAVAIGDAPISLPMNGDPSHVLLRMKPGDIAVLKGLSPAEMHDVNVLAYHTWDVDRHRLAGARMEDGTLQFTGGGGYPFFEPEPSQRIVLENFRAALSAPGEWFLSRDGRLSYIPRPGETPEQADVWAPIAERWLAFEGNPRAGQFVSNIEFRGITFEYQTYSLPDQGASFGQAESGAGAAIEASGVKGIVFDHCAMAHTLTNIAWFRRGCSDVTLHHCWMHDMGAGGVKIGDAGVSDDGPEQCSRVTIDNCILHGGGRYFQAGIGITSFHAHDCIFRHCDIADFYYTAISVGWTWGYRPTAAGHILIENCALHHLGWGVLSDMGAVYTLGPLPGTVIRGCDIQDIAVATYGGWGMYNDEGSTGVLWENNLVHHTQHAGYHMHYGRDDTVRNNIIADCEEDELQRSRPEDHHAFTFERNLVLVNPGARLFAPSVKNFQDGHVAFNHNLYWGRGAPPREFESPDDWSRWKQEGHDAGSILADPLFVNAAAGDWTLKPASPAMKIGFVAFDWRAAGVDASDALWRHLALEPLQAIAFPPKPKPTPLALRDGFETTPLGGKPMRAWQGVHIASSIAVVADHPSKGERCLQLTDGPEVQPDFDPHFYYSPHHDGGITRFAFDVRAEPAYHLMLEWRDDHEPYRTGPMLELQHGELRDANQKLLDVPADRWTHVEMTAVLGSTSDATWTAVVTIAGHAPQIFEHLKFRDPNMKTLTWLGFSSPGAAVAKCWLDEIELEEKSK